MAEWFDSTDANDIPQSATFIGGYQTGDPGIVWSQEEWDLFPNARRLRFLTDPNIPFPIPADQRPTVYCTSGNLGTMWRELNRIEVDYISADWTGIDHVENGCVGTQWANPQFTGGHYDRGTTIDPWPTQQDTYVIDVETGDFNPGSGQTRAYILANYQGEIAVTTPAEDWQDNPLPSNTGGELSAPIVAAVNMPNGPGYYKVGADGGVFAMAGAPFYGSLPSLNVKLNAPIRAVTVADNGLGYRLYAEDGGEFNFGPDGMKETKANA